ncbi:hypothetical protein [Nocardioides terrigena]|uniref:hypothetical protein n=1 Tax=Nocardioides terrigena TaxID=424797 RepID=UPI000D325007|nr:hypothetical protein [Nocardioides terrigena]
MSDAEEIDRLRARVAELEAERAAGAGTAPGVPPADRRSAWRSTAAGVMITLACVLAPLSVASVWASTVISDTDRYVETVAPIADDPDVQAAIADEVTVAIVENLDIDALTLEALGVLAEQDNMPPRVADALPALAVPLSQGIESFTHSQAERLLASPAFETVWDEVNRVAHTQVVTLLEGNEGGAVSAQDDTITLNLAPIIEQVKERLVDQGFELAARIPEIDRTFVLVESEAITSAQRGYVVLNALGAWLPFVAVGLFVGGVYAARNRRRALLRGSLGVVAAMVVLGAGLALARTFYVETTPAGILTAESAGNTFETLVRFLRSSLRAVAVLFLLLAVAAFVTGPSTGAVRTRGSVQRGLGSLRGSAEAAGWQTGPVGDWIYAHRGALRIATFLAGGLALMFWSQPTVWVVVGVAAIVVLVLLVIELLGRPPATAPAG